MPVQQLDDPVYVSEQYATEHGSAARKAIYADISGPLADIDAVRSYFGSSQRLQPHASALPLRLEEPLVAKRMPVVFVGEKAA